MQVPALLEEYNCQATTRRGGPCRNPVLTGTSLCYTHTVTDRTCTASITGGTTRTEWAGDRCRQDALPGMTVCEYHGGGAPQVREAAQRRVTEERAAKLVETYGRKIETTAVEALLDEVQWTAGHVAWLRERVQELGLAAPDTAEPGGEPADDAPAAPTAEHAARHPLVWGTTRSKTGGDDWGVTEEAAPSVWLELYMRERKHLVSVCTQAIKAGIEERRVRLAEQQGAIVAGVIRLILGDLELTPAQLALVPVVVPQRLRELAG